MTRIELEVWQRLSPLALIFLFFRTLFKFIRENLVVFAGAGAGLAFVDWLGARELVLGLIGLLLLIVAGTVMHWRRFSFRLEEDAVRVRSGVFEKKDLRVRFARVQNIQIGRPFYFRPFDVVRFSLETPGSGDKEVELPGIPEHLAEWMRDSIADLQAVRPTADSPSPDEDASDGAQASLDGHEQVPEAMQEPVWEASNGALFRHGLASNQVWVLAGVLGYLISQMTGQTRDWFERLGIDAWMARLFENGWLFVAAVVLMLAALLFVLSGLIALVRFHRFTLHDRGDRLVGIGGLLDRREQTLKREKVTGLSLKQSAVGRLIDCWYLVVRQTRAGDVEIDSGRKNFLVPGLRRARHDICSVVLPGTQPPESLERISHHYRRVYWMRGSAVLTAGWLALCWLVGVDHWIVWTALLSLPAWFLLIQLVYRHWGWRERGGMVWVQQGFLGRRLDCFPLELVQQAWFHQSPYQRRHGAATVRLVLPQGVVAIPWMPVEHAAGLVNQAIATAEMSQLHRI